MALCGPGAEGGLQVIRAAEQVHIAVFALPGLARWLRLYQWLIASAFFAFATWASLRYALDAGRFRSLGLGVSRTWPLLSLPIGFGLLMLMILLRGPWPNETPADENQGSMQP